MASDVTGRVGEGATVTNFALQIAFHMGFEKVVLIGVDHNFASKGDANKTVVSEGDDPNHFMPNYFGKGVKWQLPDLDTSEVNAGHLALLRHQRTARGWTGGIVCNTNCTVSGPAMSLRPLHDRFGVKRVFCVSMQAISGAGYPGVPSLDITDNVLPFIKGEEEKVGAETRKLLGALGADRIEEARDSEVRAARQSVMDARNNDLPQWNNGWGSWAGNAN